MKFNILSIGLLLSSATAATDNDSTNSNNNLRATNIGSSTKPQVVLEEMRGLQTLNDLEPFPGSCQLATDVYDSSNDLQLLFSSAADFEAECGVGGSCFSGGIGCCAISNADGSDRAIPYVCETEVPRTYTSAVCICNEHTAEQGIVQPTTPAPTPVPAPTTPNPTNPPTLMSDNCQRYNSNSTLYDPSLTHPWVNVGSPYEPCFTNQDCAGFGADYAPPCCIPGMCVCNFASLVLPAGETAQCVGN